MLFKHNTDKQPQKRQSSMAREEERAKQQFCTDAFFHNERMQDFQFICNTKGTQMETSTFSSIYTQTECQLQSDFAAPCNIKDLSNDHSPVSVEQESNQSECDSQNEYDSDFIMLQKSCHESHHTSFWKSQPDFNYFSVGNLMSAAVALFRVNTYQRIASFFQLANIQWILKTSYYEIQKTFLVGIVNRNYVQHSKDILMTMKRRDNCCFSADG